MKLKKIKNHGHRQKVDVIYQGWLKPAICMTAYCKTQVAKSRNIKI